MRCWLIHCSITPRQERLRLGTDRVWFYSNETPPGLQAMPDGAGTVFDAWGRHNKQDTIFINKEIIGTFCFKFLYCIIVYHSVDQKTINKGKKLEQSVYHVPDNIIWITLNTIGDPTPYTFIFIIWYFNTKKNWVTGWKTMKSSLGYHPQTYL